MKRLLAGFVLCVAAYGSLVAGDNDPQRLRTKDSIERIEQNLIVALQSDIPGLQTSAAIMLLQVRRHLPDYSWSNSIMPLMRIVNDEDGNVDARIAAALALYELRSERGDYLIARNARFTSNLRVKRFCSILTANRQTEKQTP